MGNQDLNILAVAHREFMEQMTDVLVPFLLSTMVDLYEKAVVDSNKKNILIKFQAYVKDIKSWNQGMIVEHTNAIEASCAHFKNLLAMLFVGYVKILSSIRLKESDNHKIPIRLPKSTDFIYAIYKAVAKHVHKDPFWIAEDDDEEKVDRMTKLVNDICLPEVIKSMSPMAKILETNMFGAQGEGGTDIETGENLDDGADPEVIESDEEKPEESTGEAAPVEPPEPTLEEEVEDADEVKDINLSGSHSHPVPEEEEEAADDDDDVLNPQLREK